MGFPMYYTAYSGSAPPRSGASHAAIAPYGPVPCADGVVFLSIQHQREWAVFCEAVLGQPELTSDPRFATNDERVRNRAALDAVIAATTERLSADVVAERLETAGIANARLRSVEEFIGHPQLAARERWREVGSPAGPLRALLPAATFAGQTARFDPIPDVGEQTDALLRELGYAEARIAELRAAGVV
jgi:crotonobetainyl-CoA:carnitine CoA-transferase CaiB-like acyl-CoA transferase